MDELFGEKKYISIQEVGRHFGTPVSTLRYWESVFPQLKPEKNKRGVRYYSKHDLHVIQDILFWTRTRGLSIEEAARKMKTPKESKEELIQKLHDIKHFLEELRKML